MKKKVNDILVKTNKWIFKHEVISSSIAALLMGLVIGGIASFAQYTLT